MKFNQLQICQHIQVKTTEQPNSHLSFNKAAMHCKTTKVARNNNRKRVIGQHFRYKAFKVGPRIYFSVKFYS